MRKIVVICMVLACFSTTLGETKKRPSPEERAERLATTRKAYLKELRHLSPVQFQAELKVLVDAYHEPTSSARPPGP
jgi:hypothetical protein